LWEAAAIVVELYEQYLAAEAAGSGEESSGRAVSGALRGGRPAGVLSMDALAELLDDDDDNLRRRMAHFGRV
jgi:hypothetical protein